LQECRDSADVYPTVHEFKAHSDHADPDESFKDLHRSDFILAAGCVARRKIRQLDLNPYLMGLLRRGLDKFGDEEQAGTEFIAGLEYSAAVGMTVLDVVADVNEQAIKNCHDLEAATDAAVRRTVSCLGFVRLQHTRILILCRSCILDHAHQLIFPTVAHPTSPA